MPAPLPPRCHLCRSREEIERDENGLWWCTKTTGCTYRARLRIHVRKEEAQRLLEIERFGEWVSRPEPQEEAQPQPPVQHEFCVRHSSHFCPCIAPRLYARDRSSAGSVDVSLLDVLTPEAREELRALVQAEVALALEALDREPQKRWLTRSRGGRLPRLLRAGRVSARPPRPDPRGCDPALRSPVAARSARPRPCAERG